MNKNTILVSGAVVFDEKIDKCLFLLVGQTSDGSWEFPKVIVRKGESSVRASLRLMGEKGGMSTTVLEEVGRSGGVVTINGKTIPQRHIYYLMILRSSVIEVIGFEDILWAEYSLALKKLTSKREKLMLKQAKQIYKVWKKDKQRRKDWNDEVLNV